MQIPGEIPFKMGFWHRVEGVGGGLSAKQKYGGCVVASDKTAGTGSPVPLVLVSCRYLLVNRCSFFFLSQKGQILTYLRHVIF